MEPNVLVCREEPSHVRANDPDNVPEHGDEDEEAIETQDETSTPRSPHGEFERVETCKSGICHLEKSMVSSMIGCRFGYPG